MKNRIGQLSRIADKKEKLIVGLMAGTSLDGLDIALCEVSSADFDTEVDVRAFTTIPYPEDLRHRLRQIAFRDQISQGRLCRLNKQLGTWYGRQVREQLREWEVEVRQVDLIASHGQTTCHQPSGNTSGGAATLQLGDGDQLAYETEIVTLSDFRQKFISAGGEGAPLTPFVDRLIFSSDREARLLLNIGGIANYTWLDRQQSNPSVGNFVYSDTGPGNTLINEAVRYYFPEHAYDPEGKFADEGEVHKRLLDRLLGHAFLQKDPPKSTGPESFHLEWVFRLMREMGIGELEAGDLISTLTQYTVETMGRSIERLGRERLENTHLYVSGGGVHNATLIKRLEQRVPDLPLSRFDKLGIDPDAREAMSFAVLANQSLSGEGVPITSDAEAPLVKPGKISVPNEF